MNKRGKVLRDTNSGPGLIMLEGQQYRFLRESAWKSETPPKPGLIVDVELDAHGQVQAITLVPESQLAREEAEAAMRSNGRSTASPTTISGLTNLAAAGLLAAAWFLMTAVSIQPAFSESLEFTFWQLLRFLHAGHLSSPLDARNNPGLYGVLALAALAGPLLPCLWKDKRAFLGGLLPLAFMSVAAIAVRRALQTAIIAQNATYAPSPMAISIGLGTYVSILFGLYFAIVSVRAMASARANSRHQMDSPQPKAA